METSVPHELSDTFRVMHAASYWLPPDGIAQQWGTFGSESTTASAAIEEVTEAIRQWRGATNWLNWLLIHERHEARYPATINTLHTHSTQYAQRLSVLLQAMQQEMLDTCKEQGILLSIGISKDLPHGTDEKTKVPHQYKEASR